MHVKNLLRVLEAGGQMHLAAEIRGKLEKWGFDAEDYGGPLTNDGLLVDPDKQLEVKPSQMVETSASEYLELLIDPESAIDAAPKTLRTRLN